MISTVLQFTKTELCNNNTLKVGHLEYLGNSVVVFLCVYMFRVVVVVVLLLLLLVLVVVVVVVVVLIVVVVTVVVVVVAR